MISKLQRFEGDTIIVKALVFTIKDTKPSWYGMADSEVSSKLGATKKLFSDLIELDATYRKKNDIKQYEIAYNKVKDHKEYKTENKVLAQLQSYVIKFWEFVLNSKKRDDILQDALNKKIKEKEIAKKELSETKAALAKLTADSERLQKKRKKNMQ